jgi:Family of unknown function (DUF6236)
MADSALYFPYIDVPDKPSLPRVLLYWDQLATIAPAAVPRLGQQTEELVACGLVRRVAPELYIDELEGFTEGFLSLLDGLELNAFGGSARVHRGKTTRELESALERLRSDVERVSGRRGEARDDLVREVVGRAPTDPVDTASRDVSRHLVARGLADPLGSRLEQNWLHVDERVAALYMAYLALCLGKLLHLEPITDQHRAFASVVNPAARMSQQVDRARAAILGGVLPAPSEAVAPSEIARFKERHWDQLKAFRVRVEAMLVDCVDAPSPESRDRRLEHASESLEAEVAEIEGLMRAKWPTSRGLFGAALAGAPAAAMFAATGEALEAVGAAAPVVIEVVTSLLGSAPSRSPVAYAALARSEFGG